MKFAAFCLLSAFALQCSAQEPAHITVFREKSDGNHFVASFQQTVALNRDFVQPKYWFQIYLDGSQAVGTFHPGSFVTFDVPAGRHEVRMRISERIVLDLKPGEHVYVRPSVHTSYKHFMKESVAQISCHDIGAYVGNQVLAPVKLKYVKFGEVAPENSFPVCDVQELAN